MAETATKPVTTSAKPRYDHRKGCPVCGQMPRNDFPFMAIDAPVAWPALLFHFWTIHPGMELPVTAPQDEDDLAMERPTLKGMLPDGSKRVVSYYTAIREAADTWLINPAARDKTQA